MIFSPIFDIPSIFELLIVSLFGLILGSFASALTYRVPRDISWITKAKGGAGHGLRSACTTCKTPLSVKDLIPILSWLSTRGKCRYCGAPISPIYPICESLTLLACLGIYMAYGLTWFAIPLLLMAPFLIALIMIDLKHMILPNQLVAIILAFGTIVFALRMSVSDDLNALIVNYGGGFMLFGAFAWMLSIIMKKLLKKDALGMGDVKFFFVSGLWLGVSALGNFCILGGIIGTFMGVFWQKLTGKAAFPFGPALIFSFYILLLLQGSDFMGKGINF